ncbi:MAG: hypothetical protein WBL66_17790 [Candidatus Acidiferrales bacterium]
MVSRERGSEVQIGENHAEKKPRAELLVDQAGVFCEPAKTGVFGGEAFEHRAGVDVDARLKILMELGAKPGYQPIELGLQHVVVIVAPGVARDPRARRAVRGFYAGVA